MKRTLIILALMATSWAGKAGVLLNRGESFVYEFTSIRFDWNQSPGGIPLLENAHFALGLEASTVDPGDSVLFEAFEGDTNTPPFFSRTTSSASDGWYQMGSDWTDLQGTIRITALSGSVILNVIQYGRVTRTPDNGRSVYNSPALYVPLAHLRISVADGDVSLAWPSEYSDWRLETSDQPDVPESWFELLNPRVIEGRHVLVNDTAGAPARFYRLRQP